MASELILDRTDPGINSMVEGWVDGETYDLRVKVRQNSSDPKAAKFEVVEAVDETAAEPEEESEGEYPAEKKPKGKMGKPALTISFGPN